MIMQHQNNKKEVRRMNYRAETTIWRVYEGNCGTFVYVNESWVKTYPIRKQMKSMKMRNAVMSPFK